MSVIRPVRWLLALAALTIVLAAAPASAQTCRVTSTPAFGTVKIDNIASIDKARTNATINFECPESDAIKEVLICAYIEPVDAQNPVHQNANHFYQRQSGNNSRLAWQADFGSGKAGMLKLTKTAGPLKGSLSLKITYPDYLHQDLMRAGTYISTYRLVSETIDPGMGGCPETPAKGDRSSTINFDLTTEVLPICQLESKGKQATNLDPIDFGERGSIFAAEAADGTISKTTTIDVRCTYETDYKLDLSDGKNFENGTRHMRIDNSGSTLAYQLLNATGSGAPSPWSMVSGKGNTVNTINQYKVEGRLTTPLAVAPAAGSYVDTIVVTLTF